MSGEKDNVVNLDEYRKRKNEEKKVVIIDGEVIDVTYDIEDEYIIIGMDESDDGDGYDSVE